jgi:hypothetical protein
MADENALELIKRGDRKFSARQQLDTLRQEIALNFAPHLASFTTELILGDDYAGHLIDGTPMLLARDFKSQVGAMLRPPGKQYFWHRLLDDDLNAEPRHREYLDWRSSQQRRILHDRSSGYVRATGEADEFFSFFGDACLSVDLAKDQAGLRVRSWHTKDVVWSIGDEGTAEVVTRREQVPARIMAQRYGEKNLAEPVKRALSKNPDQTFEVRHEVLPAEEYDSYRRRSLKRKDGFASIWVDIANGVILKESHNPTLRYVIPRWVTLPQWAYAISPATTIALPDARLIQQQALSILEAAEKAVNPPLVGYREAIRGDVSLRAGDITWVEGEYDGRTGAPVEPLGLGKNPGLGVDSLMRTESQITRAFYLDRLRMPDTSHSESTVKVQFMIDEYIRSALPLFAPMQVEYNDALLYEADKIIDAAGGYGARELPPGLEKDALTYQWDNPLSDMIERQKANIATEISAVGQALAAIEAAAQQAPALAQLDTSKAFSETVVALKAPGWLKDEDDREEAVQGQVDANQMASTIGAASELAPLVTAGANAAKVAQDQVPIDAEPSYPLLPMPA